MSCRPSSTARLGTSDARSRADKPPRAAGGYKAPASVQVEWGHFQGRAPLRTIGRDGEGHQATGALIGRGIGAKTGARTAHERGIRLHPTRAGGRALPARRLRSGRRPPRPGHPGACRPWPLCATGGWRPTGRGPRHAMLGRAAASRVTSPTRRRPTVRGYGGRVTRSTPCLTPSRARSCEGRTAQPPA